jgi:hypothetical protein
VRKRKRRLQISGELLEARCHSSEVLDFIEALEEVALAEELAIY